MKNILRIIVIILIIVQCILVLDYIFTKETNKNDDEKTVIKVEIPKIEIGAKVLCSKLESEYFYFEYIDDKYLSDNEIIAVYPIEYLNSNSDMVLINTKEFYNEKSIELIEKINSSNLIDIMGYSSIDFMFYEKININRLVFDPQFYTYRIITLNGKDDYVISDRNDLWSLNIDKQNIQPLRYDNSEKIDEEYHAELYDDPDEFYIDYQEEFEDEEEAYLHWIFYH